MTTLDSQYIQSLNFLKKKRVRFRRSKQSANVLFNFMTTSERLKNVIALKQLAPRYCAEDITYLKIEGFYSVTFPMKCFCDIYLNKLETHMFTYGNYGIGLNKKWGITNKIQPVQYLNEKSYLYKQIKELQKRCFEDDIEDCKIRKYAIDSLKYIKPIFGTMNREDKVISCNFPDEREWRYVPEIKNKDGGILPVVLPFWQQTKEMHNKYSDEILLHPEYCLSFDYSDIKYIVVKDKNDRREFVEFIFKLKGVDDIEKQILSSKLLVFDDQKEDW